MKESVLPLFYIILEWINFFLYSKIGNVDNLANKERVVERILDNRYGLNGNFFPMPPNQERQVLAQRNSNLMNIPMNRSQIGQEPTPQHILRSVLSQNSNDPMMTSTSHSPFATNTSLSSDNFDIRRERQLNIQGLVLLIKYFTLLLLLKCSTVYHRLVTPHLRYDFLGNAAYIC